MNNDFDDAALASSVCHASIQTAMEKCSDPDLASAYQKALSVDMQGSGFQLQSDEVEMRMSGVAQVLLDYTHEVASRDPDLPRLGEIYKAQLAEQALSEQKRTLERTKGHGLSL